MSASFLKLSRGYRYFALLFAVLGIGVVGLISTSLYGSAEIVLTAAQNRASGEYLVSIQDLPFDSPVVDPTVVPGKIQEQTRDLEQNFPATGKTTVSGDAANRVTLINTTTRGQTLIATTRLLAGNNVLLRLKERVVVPANGQIEAVVYPDQPESFTRLEPTRFTIPGLSASLQEQIYAESKTVLPVTGEAIASVTADDIGGAQASLTKALTQQALDAFRGTLDDRERLYRTMMIAQEVLDGSADAKAGDQRESFTARQQLKAVNVAFDELRIAAVVRQHLAEQLPFTHELVEIDPASLRYETQRYDPVRKEVILKVYAEGASALRPGSPLMNPAAVAGLTKAQIITYYQRYPEIQQVEVRFTPDGLPRAPRSPSRIIFTIR